MTEQLTLFPEEEQDYKVVQYFGKMVDTNGDEIYFVRTIKHGLTNYQAKNYCSDMNNKLFPGSSDYYDIIKRGESSI